MAELINLMDDYEDTQKGKYLIFSLDKENYGVEIAYVTEIIGMHTITEIPELPKYLKGIINLRGKIIPVIDIRLRFKKEPREYNDRTCIIIIDIKELSVGLIVDSVSEVITIPDNDIIPPPQLNKIESNRYVKNLGKVGNEVKILLDCEKLLSDEEFDDLSEVL